MSKGTNLGSRVSTGTDLWIYLTEPTPSGSGGVSLALMAACNGTPPTTANVFKHGCQITQMDTGTGNPATFENTGSSAVPSWTLMAAPAPGTISLTHNHVLVGSAGGVAADVPMTGDVTIADTGATAIGSGKVLLANLGSGITPSHVVKYAGKITWSGSGASLATTVGGVAATDIVVASIQTVPSQAAYLVSAAPTTNTITLVLSAANTSNDAVISYQVLRAAS